MNIKKPKEKTNRNVDQLKVLKKLEVKKNDTDTNILISNLNVKISNEKQKTTKTHSPHIKHPYIGSQINPFQNKESLISPKQATSNFINFTKRSNNIKFVHNTQSEVSMKCNLITNNTSHKNLELNSINKVANSINKSNKVKSSLITNIKDSKKPFDKQSTIFKISSKEGKFLIDTNKTIDLTGFTKNSSVINTPQNKMNIGKEFVSDQKSITVKNYEYKSSKANSSKNETLTTDTDIQTKVSSSNMSSINSKKTLFDNQTKSRFITKSISKKMKLDLSTDKINGKFIRSSKIITNQLETSNSKIKIKNIKIPIHKKEINLFSLSKGNKKSNDCSNFIKSSKNNESFLSSTIHINVNANKNKFLNNSNVAPQNFNKIDKKQIIQLDRTKIINYSRNINTERSINQGFSPKQESKKDSNNDILKTDQFYEKLSSYEIEELKNIKNVYFYGKSYENDSCILSIKIAINIDEKAMKSNGGSFTPKKINKSFEDEHGNYIVHKGDHINYRYEVISELGKGSYGQAIKCFDHKLKTYCCVKIIRKDEKFTNQAKIEIRILKYILANDKNNSSNIVKIRENFIFRKHVCIVFELLENNLYELLKSNNFSGLELNLIKSIAKQILISMYFLQNNNIIHCDLKPENIVINDSNNGSIKVIDFGSSCFDNEKLYEYIQSRYYRAPEVILGLGYNTQIDMWSFGCVLAELYNGFPIFSGENEFDQLNFIMEYLGEPPDYIKLSSKKKEMFFMDNLQSIKKENSRGKVRMPNTKKLEDFLESAEVEFIDLIKKCLVWNPFKRIKPDEALKHRFFSNDKKSFFNKNKQTHKLLNIIDNKKSNFLKYKVQINKLANLRCDHKIKSIVKNSNYSKEDQTNNHTK